MTSIYNISLNSYGSYRKQSIRLKVNQRFVASLSSSLQPFLRQLEQVRLRIDIANNIKNASQKLLNAYVDSTFRFVDRPRISFQNNFEPVDEVGKKVIIDVDSIEGIVPAEFPEGIYIRNGSNPLFGSLQSVESIYGKSNEIWVEGEGMLHAVYFTKNANGKWSISYNNKFVESETFKVERKMNKPCFLPCIEGDSFAVLAAYLLNKVRFGTSNKQISNTNVFEHSGKLYSIAENHAPQQINMFNLETHGNWNLSKEWGRPLIAHPKKAPGSGELVFLGSDARKPYLVLGIISADGSKLKHKVDLKLDRSILCHDIGVTNSYNIILDMPLTFDFNRLVKGGPLLKYEKDSYARIGVMPRYGDADSIKWFNVETYCLFHIINCFETGDEVVVRGCRALESIIPGPENGHNKYQWFSDRFKSRKDYSGDPKDGTFLTRVYEWRLNMKTGNVQENYLTGSDFSVDFPMINDHFIGQFNKYGYAQVVDSEASSACALPKYGSLAKFYFNDVHTNTEKQIKVELHPPGHEEFFSGATFVPKKGSGNEEDDGWIVSFVHNEDSNTSQVHIVDTKKFGSKPIVKLTLPQRVPYGFHGTFVPVQG